MPFADNNGVRIYYERHGQGSPAVVLIPGLGLSSAAWLGVVPALAAERQVIVVDPRGAGSSDKPPGPYIGEVLAEDVLCIIESAGITERVHLVGLSMGGMIAQHFALACPERARTLTLISTYAAPGVWSRRCFAIRRRLLDLGAIDEQFALAALLVTSPGTAERQPELLDAFESLAQAQPPDAVGYSAQLAFCETHDTRDQLGVLRTPTMVVCGSQDLLTPPELSSELAGLIPDASLHLESGSHALLFEQPGEIVRLLISFYGTHDEAEREVGITRRYT